MLFISCYFCCYIFYYTTVFVEKKKIIHMYVQILSSVLFGLIFFFKLVSGENVCCFFFIVNYISIIRVIYLLIEFLSTHIFRCLKYTNRNGEKRFVINEIKSGIFRRRNKICELCCVKYSIIIICSISALLIFDF